MIWYKAKSRKSFIACNPNKKTEATLFLPRNRPGEDWEGRSLRGRGRLMSNERDFMPSGGLAQLRATYGGARTWRNAFHLKWGTIQCHWLGRCNLYIWMQLIGIEGKLYIYWYLLLIMTCMIYIKIMSNSSPKWEHFYLQALYQNNVSWILISK